MQCVSYILNKKAQLLLEQYKRIDAGYEQKLIHYALQHLAEQRQGQVDFSPVFVIPVPCCWKIIPIEKTFKETDAFFLIGSWKEEAVELNERLGCLEQDIKTIVDFFPGKLYWKDLNSCYVGANQEWLALVGRHAVEEIVGQRDEVFFGADEAKLLRKNDQWVMETQKVLVQEESVRLENGEIRHFLATKRPRYDAQGRLSGIIGNSIDITDRKKLEEEIIAVKASEERFKAMSALGGMIAHELRTHFAALRAAEISLHHALPTLIEGYECGLATGKIREPIRKDRLEGLKSALFDIEYSINYSQSIIDNIFAGFRYTKPTRVMGEQFFILSVTVKESIDKYPLQPSQVTYIHNHCHDALAIAGEANILIHVLRNLLKNALQAIDKAGKGKIIIESVQKNNEVLLTFTDTATGIESEHLPHIFEVFYTTKNKDTRSLGLGLYFCKMALEHMKGSITCESQLGEYTRFYITLPLKQDSKNG